MPRSRSHTQLLSCPAFIIVIVIVFVFVFFFFIHGSSAFHNHSLSISWDWDWDEFGESKVRPDDDLDPGSWRPIFEPDDFPVNPPPELEEYYSAVRKIVNAMSKDGASKLEEAASEIEAAAAAAAAGNPHAQSVLGFLYGIGMTRKRDAAKAFMYHTSAADSGSMHSKMALAYAYSLQDGMHEKAVTLYAGLAKAAVRSFSLSKDPTMKPVRIHDGAEESKEALWKSRREEDEKFQTLEYEALKGNAGAMYKIGLCYYFRLRGVRRNHATALAWFSKAAEKGEMRSMEFLGEIYVRGVGVEQNYTKALEWLTLASGQQLCSAYSVIGYLYLKGDGVEQNYTKAREYFEKAADSGEAGGHYNLGVMYLKGIGVKKNVKLALRYFVMAANAGHPKASYQLAKMFHRGVGVKKNLLTAMLLYRAVVEKGPWSSLSRWAYESYLKGDVGKAFLLYSRMAELGIEVAQSNAAWILDKYGEDSMCMGESGLCTDAERHQRARSLWLQASKQGNEYATSLVGDVYTAQVY